MTASKTALRDVGDSSAALVHPHSADTPFSFLVPASFSFESDSTSGQGSSSVQDMSGRAREGRAAPRRRRAGAGRGVQGAVDSGLGAVAARGVQKGQGGLGQGDGAASEGWDGQGAPACSSEAEDASSSDWESPRRPHKRVCRPPLVANQQHLVPPPRPPGSSSFDLASATLSPPGDMLDDLERAAPSFARLPPFEVAFYKDCSSDSSDLDEDSVGPPSQPLSDAETSGENQLRRTPPPPRTFARRTLSPIDNMSSSGSSTRRRSTSSPSSSAPSARSSGVRRMSSPARGALATELSALALGSPTRHGSDVDQADVVECAGSSSDEGEGALLEEEPGRRFEECPVGNFAPGRASAW